MRPKPALPILQPGNPFARNLWAAWLMYEGAGSVLQDSSRHRRLATPGSFPAWRSPNHLHFTSDWLLAGTYPAGTTITVAARVRDAANWYVVGSHPTSGGTLWFLGRNSGNGATFRYNNAGERQLNTPGVIFNDGLWHDLVGITTPTAAFLYVDGEYEASLGIGGSWEGKALWIGCQGNGATSFTGDIEWIQIWENRAFTPAEVRTLHADPLQAFRAPSARLAVAVLPPPGTTTIRLNWTDNSEHEDGFSIERKTDAGAFAEIDTVAAGVETYDDGPIDEGHTYTYRVKATSAAIGDSEYSNEAAETV